jgi:hypothetical protein
VVVITEPTVLDNDEVIKDGPHNLNDTVTKVVSIDVLSGGAVVVFRQL